MLSCRPSGQPIPAKLQRKIPWRKGRIYEIFPHDANIAAQLSRIVYWKQVHHLGCPSARKCGILCFSAYGMKKDAPSAKIQLQSNPHLRTHKISPGVCFATLYSPLLRRNTHSFSPCFTNVPHVFAGYVGPVSLRNFNNNKAEVLRYSLWCVT